MASDSESEDRIVDYDLSEDQIKSILREFGVQNHELNSPMIEVMQLVTTAEFYENKEEVSNIPDYGFRIHDIIVASEMAENTRESVRKDVLKPLRPKGVLDYTEPAPNSPHTHYYLSQEFRDYLQNTELDEVISEPEEAEEVDRTFTLPYHEGELERAPGDHTELLAKGLKQLVPKITEDPVLVHEGLDKTEREDIQEKLLPVDVNGDVFRLTVYPDAIVYDQEDEILYLLESVTSRGPFTNRRISKIRESIQNQESEIEFDLVFITMFPDERRYRNHLMKLGDGSYVWVADHGTQLRAHGKMRLEDLNSGDDFLYRHRP
jgi:hypothetical protein